MVLNCLTKYLLKLNSGWLTWEIENKDSEKKEPLKLKQKMLRKSKWRETNNPIPNSVEIKRKTCLRVKPPPHTHTKKEPECCYLRAISMKLGVAIKSTLITKHPRCHGSIISNSPTLPPVFILNPQTRATLYYILSAKIRKNDKFIPWYTSLINYFCFSAVLVTMINI